jgi:hypothetical protein
MDGDQSDPAPHAVFAVVGGDELVPNGTSEPAEDVVLFSS